MWTREFTIMQLKDTDRPVSTSVSTGSNIRIVLSICVRTASNNYLEINGDGMLPDDACIVRNFPPGFHRLPAGQVHGQIIEIPSDVVIPRHMRHIPRVARVADNWFNSRFAHMYRSPTWMNVQFLR